MKKIKACQHRRNFANDIVGGGGAKSTMCIRNIKLRSSQGINMVKILLNQSLIKMTVVYVGMGLDLHQILYRLVLLEKDVQRFAG